MKRRKVVVVVALSLSLATQAGAADTRTSKVTAGWLDRVVEWIAKAAQPVASLWKEDTNLPAAPGGAGGGAGLDGGGCLDPFGRPGVCG